MPSRNGGAPAATGKWLAVVGIGEDGQAGLSERARDRIENAETVFGGERHLALVEPLIRGTAEAWPKPFDAEMTAVRARRHHPTCVLASGDPMLFGVGATLVRFVPAEEMEVVPAPSAFSLAAARLGWALQDTDCISLHGRATERVRPLLQPGARVLALTSDADGPAALARFLAAQGFGASTLHVLEALGGEHERITTHSADTFEGAFHALNLVAIEVVGGRVLALAPGLPDALFRHDGQITKRPIRALTLSALAPRRGELLWDVGAGSGSVAVEWMLAHPSLRAIAIERRADRIGNIRENARALGVPDLRIVEGDAPAAFAGLEAPDAIFLGGGGSRDSVVEAAIDALKPGGRLVANAVTLQMEAELLRLHASHGGELLRFGLSQAEGVGSMTGWRPSMPTTQWTWVKP